MKIEMKEQTMWDRLFEVPFSVIAAIVGFALMFITLAGWSEFHEAALFFFGIAVASRFEEHLRQIRTNTTALAMLAVQQEAKRARTASMWEKAAENAKPTYKGESHE